MFTFRYPPSALVLPDDELRNRNRRDANAHHIWNFQRKHFMLFNFRFWVCACTLHSLTAIEVEDWTGCEINSEMSIFYMRIHVERVGIAYIILSDTVHNCEIDLQSIHRVCNFWKHFSVTHIDACVETPRNEKVSEFIRNGLHTTLPFTFVFNEAYPEEHFPQYYFHFSSQSFMWHISKFWTHVVRGVFAHFLLTSYGMEIRGYFVVSYFVVLERKHKHLLAIQLRVDY